MRIVEITGALVVSRTAPGRGAWLCRDSATCIDLAARRGAFSRALRVAIAPAAVQRLQSELSERH